MASRREYELIAKQLCANLSRLERFEIQDAQQAYAIRAARNAIVDVTRGLAEVFEGLSTTFDRERFYLASGLTNVGLDPIDVATFVGARKRAK